MSKLYNKTLFQIKQIIACIDGIDGVDNIENITTEKAKIVRQRFERLGI